MEMPKIMIVEDEAIVALMIENKLTENGYKAPLIVDNGEEAIRNLEEIEPDLILMDINIKGEFDGIETAKQIREKVDVPIIFMTAYADEKTQQRAKISGLSGYLIKPFDGKELRSKIEMLLYRK